MINLIPPSAKKSVSIEYWTRVSSVALLILSGIIATSTLLLLPIYVRINSQIKVYAESAKDATDKVSKYDLSSSALVKASTQARLLLDLQDEQTFTAIIATLLAFTNAQISIDSFELNRDKDGLTPIQITGKSLTRQSLADFRKTLLEHKDIRSAFLPISNLTQDKDISFTVTVTMEKPT